MNELYFLVAAVIVLALFFDFTNGFHDTANAMATPIATGALKPKTAVTIAAILNLIGAFISVEVAKTISGGLINESAIGAGGDGVNFLPFIFAGLIGAIVWNLITWLLGLPSSSSHALFGGLIGAALVGAGITAVNYEVLLAKIIIPAVLAPTIAGLGAFLTTRIAYKITRRYDGRPDGRGGFRWGQIFSSSFLALSHGTNDAQKVMGVITLALVSANMQEPGSDPQFWVILSCALAIALGTYSGGWRIIRTLGTGLTEVKPAQGFAAEVTSATTVLVSSHFGFALSTTQVASGSIIGSGLGRRGSKVKWRTAGRIGIAWLMTLPASGIVGALAAWVAHFGMIGYFIDTFVGMMVILGIWLWSRKQKINHENAVSGVAASAKVVKIKKNVKPLEPRRAKKARKVAKARKKEKAEKVAAKLREEMLETAKIAKIEAKKQEKTQTKKGSNKHKTNKKGKGAKK